MVLTHVREPFGHGAAAKVRYALKNNARGFAAGVRIDHANRGFRVL